MTQGEAIDTDKRALDRMLFFSDAVFAIALTLLVLDLRVPASVNTEAAMAAAVTNLEGPLTAFFGSFALIGQWWLLHMRMTRKMVVFDWPTTVFNLVYLLFVVLMPFGTSLIGTDNVSQTAFEVYWTINAGASISLGVMFLVMSRGGGRLIGGITWGQRLFRFLRSIGSGIAFIVGFWLATRGEFLLSGMAWVLMFPIFFVLRLLQGVFGVRT